MDYEDKIIKIMKNCFKQLKQIKYLKKGEKIKKYYEKMFEIEKQIDLKLNTILDEKKSTNDLIQKLSSLVVKLINNYHFEISEIEKEKRKEFIKNIEIDFMEGVEEPWCNNAGVGVLPYVLKDNKYYYLLLFKEYNPLFKNKQISEYSTVTGGLEKHDITRTVINEMWEEVGIDITNEDEATTHFLGSSFVNKSSTKLWNYFGIDLTKMNLNLTAIYKGTGDGTKAEKSIKGKFVTEEELMNCNDSISLVIIAKFTWLIKNVISQSFNPNEDNNQLINEDSFNQPSTSRNILS